MATDFSANYICDYISIADSYKIIKSGGDPIQIIAQTGLLGSFNFNQKKNIVFFNDIGQPNYCPLDSYVTDISIPGKDDKLTSLSFFSSSTECESIYKDYDVNLDHNMLLRKRALEIYGPLNPQMVKHYKYKLENEEGDTLKVSFHNKKTTFSKHMRINVNGQLYIGKGNGRIFKIYCTDFEDRYSSYIYLNGNCLMNKAAKSTFEVSYINCLGGIVAEQIAQKVEWIEPSLISSERAYYSPEFAPYRNPYKLKLSTICKTTLHNSVLCTDSIKKYIERNNMFVLSYVNNSDYCYWHTFFSDNQELANCCNILGGYNALDRQAKAMNELLRQQILSACLENGRALLLSEEEIQANQERALSFTERTKHIYNILYSNNQTHK